MLLENTELNSTFFYQTVLKGTGWPNSIFSFIATTVKGFQTWSWNSTKSVATLAQHPVTESTEVIETSLCFLVPGMFSQRSELHHNFLDWSLKALRFFICDEFVFNLHLACSFYIYTTIRWRSAMKVWRQTLNRRKKKPNTRISQQALCIDWPTFWFPLLGQAAAFPVLGRFHFWACTARMF